jgi:hypothetical protein
VHEALGRLARLGHTVFRDEVGERVEPERGSRYLENRFRQVADVQRTDQRYWSALLSFY